MKNGAVAFLDVLGFKGIWRNTSEEEVLERQGRMKRCVQLCPICGELDKQLNVRVWSAIRQSP